MIHKDKLGLDGLGGASVRGSVTTDDPRTPNPGKTNFADDDTLAYIAKMEAELASIKNVGMEPAAELRRFDTGESRPLGIVLHDTTLDAGTKLYSAAQLAKVRAERDEANAKLAEMYAKHPENACYDVPTWNNLRTENAELSAQIALAREALGDRRRLSNSLTDVVVGALHYFDLCDKKGPLLDFEDAKNANKEAIERYRNDPRFHAKSESLVARLMDAAAKHIEDALSTLTTGNAVQAIEARALREAAEYFDKDVDAWEIAGELRKLAEQKE